jgi:hypothetical protein
LDEVAAVAEGTYVPDGESKSRPRQADKVDSTPDAGDEGVTLESIEFVTEGGRVLTADEVMDIVEGRAERVGRLRANAGHANVARLP